jgi:hypothetical protein
MPLGLTAGRMEASRAHSGGTFGRACRVLLIFCNDFGPARVPEHWRRCGKFEPHPDVGLGNRSSVLHRNIIAVLGSPSALTTFSEASLAAIFLPIFRLCLLLIAVGRGGHG